MELSTKYLIIGGGFSGLYLQKLFIKNNINHILIDGGIIGGQLNLYLKKKIYDIPGIFSITGEDLLNKFNINNTIIPHCKAQNITFINNNKKIVECDHWEIKTIICEKIIMATGKGMVKPMKIVNENLEKILSLGKVFYEINYVPKNKIIAILGGGDSAMDALETLSHNNFSYLIHRRPMMTAMEGKLSFLKNNYILMTNTAIEDYQWDENQKKIIITSNNIDHPKIMVDYIYIFYGLITENNGLNHNNKIMVHEETMKSDDLSIDFALGDGAIYPNKRFLIHNYMDEAAIILQNILINESRD